MCCVVDRRPLMYIGLGSLIGQEYQTRNLKIPVRVRAKTFCTLSVGCLHLEGLCRQADRALLAKLKSIMHQPR